MDFQSVMRRKTTPTGQRIRSDGTNFIFTPGKTGSLMSLDRQKRVPLLPAKQPGQSKIISSPFSPDAITNTGYLENVKKRRSRIIEQKNQDKATSITATRG